MSSPFYVPLVPDSPFSPWRTPTAISPPASEVSVSKRRRTDGSIGSEDASTDFGSGSRYFGNYRASFHECKKQVLLIHTGGTIGMTETSEGLQNVTDTFVTLLKKYPVFCKPPTVSMRTDQTANANDAWQIAYELHDWLHVECLPKEIDSSQIEPTQWWDLARRISEALGKRYWGVVVTHGTDTLAYTASALTFMLRDLIRPVILTAAQISLACDDNDAVSNLYGALCLARQGFDGMPYACPIPEVCVYFNRKVLRGNRIQKVDANGLDAFSSPNCQVLGHFDGQFKLNMVKIRHIIDKRWELRSKHGIVGSPVAVPGAHRVASDVKVAMVHLYPGFQQSIFLHLIKEQKVRGIVVRSFGTGNGPKLQADVAKALGTVAVVNCTECHKGIAETKKYAAAFKCQHLVDGRDMTPEAALAKLYVLLSGAKADGWIDDIEKTRHYMKISLRGELTSNKPERISELVGLH